MTSRADILYYFGVIICIYLWENLLFGNLTAYYEKAKGKIQLQTGIKRILFPLFNIAKFTYVNLIYQVFNFFLFILMICIGIIIVLFGVNEFIIYLVNIYSKFQRFYWLLGPILLELSMKYLA